jgi:tripartite-type tricarboxylate transporter receptor subunit TctC
MKKMLRFRRPVAIRAGLALALAAGVAGPARSGDVENFYKGKIVSVAIGYPVGGGYDVYARVLARFMGRHIPGNPTMLPRNMPGAGSLMAANYLSSIAPKDGTVIGAFSRTIAAGSLYSPAVKFDASKLVWLGSIVGDDTQLCITGARSPIKTWTDMLTMPTTMGVPTGGTEPDIFARLYKNLFGAKIKIVAGYPGTNDITLAMERGEVDGQCGATVSTLRTAHPDILQDKSVNFLVQAGLKKNPQLPDVPLARDLTSDAAKKQILDLIMLPEGMARPFATTPGIPDERRAALIKAFDETMKDPEFLNESAKERMDVSPVTAGEIDDLLKKLHATPKDVVARAAQVITE